MRAYPMLLMAATLTALLALAGCSSPQDQFMNACMKAQDQDKDRREKQCRCMGERLHKNLSQGDFKQVVDAIQSENGKEFDNLEPKLLNELMMAAKACS